MFVVMQRQMCTLLLELLASKGNIYVETGLSGSYFPATLRSKFTLLLIVRLIAASNPHCWKV